MTQPYAPIHVFVYGTLKAGQSNHGLLETCGFIGDAVTLKKYWMLSNGGFPVVVDFEERASVYGEVYEVDERVLERLDNLEGHPQWYCRREVTVDLSDSGIPHTVWMYLGTRKGWGNSVPRMPEVQVNGIGIYNWSR